MSAAAAGRAPDWRRVEELFNEALERPAAGRESWLRAACRGDAALEAEVLSLLSCDGDDGFLAEPIAESAAAALAGAAPPAKRVGPYRLDREIGRGGMGTVYLGERADGTYTKTVAVKLVRPSLDTEFLLARFRTERQILAGLEHTNIGRLLDGGTAEDGTPYLVMEYVDGPPITHHCEARALSLRARLELFREVVAAVQYAHAHLVIHRDIKPGNILVGRDGHPKLLDFGICKLLYDDVNDATLGLRLLTPDYASPEQISGGPVGVASDVYSLGAVLYELVTGVRPHRLDRLDPRAVEDAICRSALVPPSEAARRNGRVSWARRLEGDLDAIVAKAMRAEPAERYLTAQELGEDLGRHLDGWPVAARGRTLGYRAARGARRNAVLLVALVGVTAALGAELVLAARARAARRELDLRTAEEGALQLEAARAYLRLGELAAPRDPALARSSYRRARAIAESLPASGEARALAVRARAALGEDAAPAAVPAEGAPR